MKKIYISTACILQLCTFSFLPATLNNDPDIQGDPNKEKLDQEFYSPFNKIPGEEQDAQQDDKRKYQGDEIPTQEPYSVPEN